MEFLPWLRSWGAEARAVSPGELVERVAGDLRAAAARYECREV
jgi:predicted DNA-binding transcriptional regulator YafY